MIERGELFLRRISLSRSKIADLCHTFIKDGAVSRYHQAGSGSRGFGVRLLGKCLPLPLPCRVTSLVCSLLNQRDCGTYLAGLLRG